jgi:hypothetical protein
MNRDDIIAMAQEAIITHSNPNPFDFRFTTVEQLECFAALVAAAERERMDLNAIHSCHAECQNPFCVRVREAVAHEREACAKFLIDLYESDGGYHPAEEFAKNAAAVIRARGAV